ncbi:MAG: PIN domain-containing protein [Herpetosiphonaceae bacterium]|nr:PIN domain-containing protein [Herpetosiphonaceae bacterium]
MHISLDTNVWIFGIVAGDPWCKTILFNLAQFRVTLADQVRVELERNLSPLHMRQFYHFVLRDHVVIDAESVPIDAVHSFEHKGLKKGDAVIGAFCEWRNLDILVSDNRHFLRELSPDHEFVVMSPQHFCETFELS